MTKTSPLLSKRFGAGTAAVLSHSRAGSTEGWPRWWYAHDSLVLADAAVVLMVALLVNPLSCFGNCID